MFYYLTAHVRVKYLVLHSSKNGNTEKKTTLESDLNFFLPYPVFIYPNVLPC